MASKYGGSGSTVVSIGELLVDFVPLRTGCELCEVERFERAAGGAPANVAAAVARLGGHAAMISQVGQDAFGTFLTRTLAREGVDVRWVYRTDRANTGLAFVSLTAEGEREFSFFRNPSADLFLEESQIAPRMFDGCAALHFCSVDLVDWPVAAAHRRAVKLARAAGAIVSFDPNVRLPLWSSAEACRKTIREHLPCADIVKLSEDEMEFCTGCASENEAAEFLFARGCSLFVATRGARGAAAYTPRASATVSAPEVPVADTTGAGDAFIGSFLFQLARDGIKREDLECVAAGELEKYLAFSAHYASLTVQREGARMATMEEVRKAMGRTKG